MLTFQVFHFRLQIGNASFASVSNVQFIPSQLPYTSENVVEGKRAAKQALQQRLGLETADLPLVGIITRLTHQKGIHLIKHAIWRTLERNGQVGYYLFSSFQLSQLLSGIA